MHVQYNYSKDEKFLLEIDNQHLKEQFAKITLLDWDENPIQEIQGLVTNGTLNLDGKSAVRRTGNISVFLKNNSYSHITNVNNLFSINKKIYIEIGYKNNTNKYLDYDIIWFPQGVFVINSANSSKSTTGTTLNFQIKDKMCLLNGDCGGVIPASVQFDTYETLDDKGNIVISKPTIAQIIRELVNHFGKEQLGKIIISDIDTTAKMIMKWVGSSPVYKVNNNGTYTMTTDYSIAAAASSYEQFNYGEDVGYIYTDFTYPTELIANPGDTIVTILDKIKATLGNYEYFYDINGNFIFREIKNYLNTSQAKEVLDNLNNSSYIIDISKGKTSLDLSNSELITAISNSPQYNKIKNDFIVWGKRKNTDGFELPIRYHLAIDKKPEVGNMYSVIFYQDEEDGLEKAKTPISFESIKDFPTVGLENCLYQDSVSGKIYIWKENEYKQISVISDEYIQLDYIEATGQQQWIDTLLLPKEAARMDAEITWTKDAASGSSHFVGGYGFTRLDTSIETDCFSFFWRNKSNGVISLGYNKQWIYTKKVIEANMRMRIKSILKQKQQELWVNDACIYQGKSNDIRPQGTDTTIPLFAYRYQERILTDYGWAGRCYWVKFYDENDNIVRDYMPCQRKSDGAIGLLDLAYNTFYANKGTIPFIGGDPVEDSNLSVTKIKTTDWRSELYLQGVNVEPLGLESNYYYPELQNEWPKLYNLKANYIANGNYYTGAFKPEVLKDQDCIDYFLDFIDSDAAISEISVNNIGRRSSVKTDNDVNCIFSKEIPDFVLIELGQEDTEKQRQECFLKGQPFIQVDSYIYSMLATGGVQNSAYDKVKMMLYQETSYNESIQITILPIYHIEPNTRIKIRDIDNDIYGDYVIQTISLPLAANGTSTISATRAMTQL